MKLNQRKKNISFLFVTLLFTLVMVPAIGSMKVKAATNIHNFTMNGLSSSFFQIEGNLSKTKGAVTYNGLTLTQCLKIESKTSIIFSTEDTSVLTLVFNSSNSSNIKVDGTTYTLDKGIVSVTLQPGNHEITKANTGNLYYMFLESANQQMAPVPSTTVPPVSTQAPITAPVQGSSMKGKVIGYGANAIGGKGGKEVVVSNSKDLEKYATASEAYIIKVQGNIVLSDTQVVGSNKTIVGVGSNGTLTGAGLHVKKAQNVIIQNLTIHHNNTNVDDNDAIRIEASHDVWVDHCTLDSQFKVAKENSSHKDDTDGACDIKKGSYGITVSYCLFQNNWKNMLISHSDSQTADKDITVTIHHNIFKDCSSRMPSIRFGKAHIYNNYFVNALTSTINSRMGAETFIENNYFENCKKAIGSEDSKTVGYWNLAGNIFVGSSGVLESSTCTYKPNYTYTVEAANQLPAVLKTSAGAGRLAE